MTAKGNKSIAIAAGVIAAAAALVVGVFLYWDPPGIPFSTEQQAGVKADAPLPDQPKPPDKTIAADDRPLTPTAVPSFDVVRIEPSGEGVVAGRAEPGWTVSVEAAGKMIAETTADDVGEWTVVLETPLAEGEQTLSLQAMSPDGTRVLIAPDPVVAAVGKAEEAVAALAAGDKSPEPTREPDAVSESAPSSTNETQLADQSDADVGPSETVFSEEAGEGRDTTHAGTLPEPPALAETPSVEAPSAETSAAETEAQSPAVVAVVPSAPSEQPIAAEPERPQRPPVVFKTVDYQDEGAETGKISLSGRGDPGARIVLYLDDQPLGQAKIGADGTWSFATEKRLELGAHYFRADHLDAATGLVVGRALIGMKRTKPVPVVAAQEPAPESQDAVPGAPALVAQESGQESGDGIRPKVYEVRPGDTLWDIAERFFGGGWRYKQIYDENREQIRKPDLIYPEQQFDMPDHE